MKRFEVCGGILCISMLFMVWAENETFADGLGSEHSEKDVNVLPVPVVFFTPETGTGAGGGIYITYSFALELLLQRAVGDVPFRKLPMLGGQSLLRGFFLGRFRDNVLQAIQTEYRHIVTDKVGVNFFLSEGSVGEVLQQVLKKTWHVSGGFGFRYIIVKESNLGLRLDIARTSEETSIYFGAGEAF